MTIIAELTPTKLDSFHRIASRHLLSHRQTLEFRRIRTPRAVQFIKISFNNSDPERPYQIKKIEVKGEGCEYERVPLGINQEINCRW